MHATTRERGRRTGAPTSTTSALRPSRNVSVALILDWRRRRRHGRHVVLAAGLQCRHLNAADGWLSIDARAILAS